MRAVDYDFDAPLPSHLADSLDRKNLAGKVRNVAYEDDFGARRDRSFEALVQIVHRRRRNRERNVLYLDAVAALALSPRREHSPVILIGCEDLIARLEIQTEDAYLECLARISSDRHLF